MYYFKIKQEWSKELIPSNKYISRLAAFSLCFILTIGQTMADQKINSAKSTNQNMYAEIVQLTQARLENLKGNLNLQASETTAWNQWFSQVIAEVKKQHEADIKFSQSWLDNESDNPTTPEKLVQQETHLKAHITHMQNQLNRLEKARVNTINFYNMLSKDQQTIFDLFWQK